VENFCRVQQTTYIIWFTSFICWVTKAANTRGICNTYSFFVTKVFTRKRLSVTFYVRGLSCLADSLSYQEVARDKIEASVEPITFVLNIFLYTEFSTKIQK